jgi:signal transduction histidine kinase
LSLKRILVGLALLLPLAILAFLTAFPQFDLSVSLPLPHFYIVTFTTFSAAVVSILLAASLGPEASSRHVLAAAGFALMGAVFFSHGFATPGALIDHFHPAVQWSSWLTLFGGSLLFTCAVLEGPNGMPRWLPVRPVIYVATGAVLLYSAIAAFAPDVLIQIQSMVNPWHQWTIFIATLLLWCLATVGFTLVWRRTHNRVDGVLAFVAFWMIAATISMHRYTLWNLSWWLYHATLLMGFLITVYVLVQQYEQLRQFRLREYYLGLSLIITALLALAASALFTQFSYNTLVGQLQATTTSIANNLANSIARDLPDVSTPDQLRRLTSVSGIRGIFDLSMTGLPIQSVLVYDDAGVAAYASEPDWIGVNVEDRAAFQTALGGQTVATIRPPTDPPATYAPSEEVYILETYAPLHPDGNVDSAPIGVLVTVEEAPQIGAATISARVAGLVTASVTMGLLFLALLTVVGRADQILASRSGELATAYTNLRESESMRDDLTNMIVHDLRNPLTAISASLDFVTRLNTDGQRETRTRMVSNAQAASQRMMGMIEDMLTVSKIEAGQLSLQRQHAVLDEILSSAILLFAAQAIAEQKTITLTCPPALVVVVEQTLIRRVVENLIANALKYTDNKIEVIATDSPDRVTITVRDDGEGVPDEHKQRIFKKFVQLSREESYSARKGAGLGLAFCSLVVREHGGDITVTDAPGRGSDFVVWLPKQPMENAN